MPTRRLDPRVIAELYDALETKISEKVRSDFKSEMELMKNDMVVEIIRAIVGVPRNVGMENGYEEAVEDFETIRSSGRANQDERPRGNRVVQLDRSGS